MRKVNQRGWWSRLEGQGWAQKRICGVGFYGLSIDFWHILCIVRHTPICRGDILPCVQLQKYLEFNIQIMITMSEKRTHLSLTCVQTTPLMSADVGSDITLMNALTAISSTTVVLGGSAPRSMICSTEGQQPNGGGHASSPLATSEGRPESSAAAAATRSAVTPLKVSLDLVMCGCHNVI